MASTSGSSRSQSGRSFQNDDLGSIDSNPGRRLFSRERSPAYPLPGQDPLSAVRSKASPLLWRDGQKSHRPAATPSATDPPLPSGPYAESVSEGPVLVGLDPGHPKSIDGSAKAPGTNPQASKHPPSHPFGTREGQVFALGGCSRARLLPCDFENARRSLGDQRRDSVAGWMGQAQSASAPRSRPERGDRHGTSINGGRSSRSRSQRRRDNRRRGRPRPEHTEPGERRRPAERTRRRRRFRSGNRSRPEERTTAAGRTPGEEHRPRNQASGGHSEPFRTDDRHRRVRWSPSEPSKE